MDAWRASVRSAGCRDEELSGHLVRLLERCISIYQESQRLSLVEALAGADWSNERAHVTSISQSFVPSQGCADAGEQTREDASLKLSVPLSQ